MWLLPQNPGPFGTLADWQQWRQELVALGSHVPGVDVELQVADVMIADLVHVREAAVFA